MAITEVITLLRPRAVFAKRISGAGRWGVRYRAYGEPSFCTVLEGRCRLAVDGEPAITLEAGDFVLLPATPAFTMSGFEPVTPTLIDPDLEPAPGDEVRHGRQDGAPDVRLLGGYFVFDSPDAGLLASLLPAIVHMRDAERLATLVQLVGDEAIGTAARPRARAHAPRRGAAGGGAARRPRARTPRPGLLRGLADTRLAPALRELHGEVERSWTVTQLARAAALSRSAFFERFTRTVGVPPMEYLLAWRMALAKDLLDRRELALAEIAERVGYGSASSFSTAFSRYVGVPPSQYAR